MDADRLVPDAELDFDSNLVFTLDGALFTGTAFEETPDLGRSEVVYRDGIQEGPARDWYPSGVLKGESHYVQGVLHGTEREFREVGTLAEESRYEYGIRVLRKTFAADGAVISTQELDENSAEAALLCRMRREHGWPT
ncbi:toxin-antitoxin system YwqK family antitoxin [Cellulosimicrobium marinum]|uniref:toxin-antitoxin system YwqK family antitoxin n=1 Tax=Cellulosimicrobium marinum TaxID=1638992 RepID=UPI001E368873|nr:hypothetical protein [Cellulosimicrobium marinum]MCB7135693.1 hypothetical protein [Cellulosimicrobium marinum]